MIEDKLKSYAIKVGLSISKEYINEGEYYPKEAWGCEGQIYPSLMGLSLLDLYKDTNNLTLLNAVESIIKSNIKKQLPSGGWALALGSTANGLRFEVTPKIIEITSKIEDLPPTVTALRLQAEYQILTNDKKYIKSLKKGYDFLIRYWNSQEQIFDEMLIGDALKLRANPKNYQIYTYQAIVSLSKIFIDAEKYIIPLYESVKKIFEEMDSDTYPLLYALYAAVIIEKEGASNYVTRIVKKRIIEEIAMGSRFIIKELPGALGHRDGLRGICLDEGHLRNSVGAALAMKFYDLNVEKNSFILTDFYSNLISWIESMFENDKFYEFVDIKTATKHGVGTPGQYLPICLVLGKI